MLSLGSKKKDNLSRMDRKSEDLPQLSNEMQLMIMNKVKNGEMTIEDALDQARRDRKSMHKQQSNAEELQEQRPTQHNFSVHKHSRYRWQKRVLQIDFKTKMICSIEKGIIKRQLAFSMVKSCDDGVGSRFSISFKGHHDYELEATSREDKHKITQLVNQIIYGNIYDPAEGDAESSHEPEPSQSLKEGVLLLHRGGLASFRWVKYEVQLHPGQLTLVPFRKRALADGEVTSYVPQPIVVHLSDGHTSVQKPPGSDIFTLITHKNEYQFRVPLQDQTTAPGSVQKQRDSWVQAIDKLCSDWKRKSMGEHMFVETKALRNISIEEDVEDSDTDLEECQVPSVVNTSIVYPTIDYKDINPTSSSGGEGRLSWDNTSEINPSANDTKPVPKPRGISRGSIPDISPDLLIPIAPSTSPVDVFDEFPPASPKPKPTTAIIPSSSPVPKSPGHELGPSVVKVPLLSRIPAPPPLPFKPLLKDLMKPRTKAFHWDIVASEKIAKSFWTQESSGRIEIDKVRLYEQFAVKDLGTFSVPEPSDTQQIMLNEKIAHNFNIFLKSFPVQPTELKDKVFIVNEEDGGLSDEHITSLRRYVPTMDDVEMYKSHKGPVAELHIVDQYMMEMCNIPYLSTQLDLLLTLREIPSSINDLQPLINQKIRMCTQLNNCRSFISVLEHLLAIGNYLNDNARKGKARGFRLSSLTKVSELRGRDRKFTLLHALVEQIMLHEPCLASFTQELAEFETVPGASIKGLTAEVDVLKNELQKVLQYKKTSKKRNAGVQHPNFSKDLKTAIEKYNTDLSALTKTCEEMKKLYSVTLVKFGEPADQDSQELFGLICQFVHDFRRVHTEII